MEKQNKAARLKVPKYFVMASPSPSSPKSILAFDIGGTNVRFGVVQSGQLVEIRKGHSPSFVHFPGMSGEELVSKLMKVICSTIEDVHRRFPSVEAVAVGMPGMVTRDGVVSAAPPLWGNLISGVPLQEAIQKRTGLKVTVFNDLCGTAVFYSELPEFTGDADFLTLITLSTGIGCKTVDLKQRRLLTDSFGRGGEVGHVRVDFTDEALPCDCGGEGHLSSYLSGRGILRLIRFMAEKHSVEYQSSQLNPVGDDEALMQRFVQAVRLGDAFAWKVLDCAAAKLIRVIATISGTLGVDRYVLVGGLAFALSKDLCLSLSRHLEQIGIWGWDRASLLKLVRIGISDDNHGLLGTAKYGLLTLDLEATPSAPPISLDYE